MTPTEKISQGNWFGEKETIKQNLNRAEVNF